MKDNYRQVEVATYENEPLGRLSEQRLYQAGIPCVLKSLQGGAGLWGSAYNVPHSLYVYEHQVDEATEILGIDSIFISESPTDGYSIKQWPSWLVISVVLVVVLVLVCATSVVRLV